jgi:hypothetical protein
MARQWHHACMEPLTARMGCIRKDFEPLTRRLSVERVTGIEPALSAWEVCGVLHA